MTPCRTGPVATHSKAAAVVRDCVMGELTMTPFVKPGLRSRGWSWSIWVEVRKVVEVDRGLSVSRLHSASAQSSLAGQALRVVLRGRRLGETALATLDD